jgi:hypothetical protein
LVVRTDVARRTKPDEKGARHWVAKYFRTQQRRIERRLATRSGGSSPGRNISTIGEVFLSGYVRLTISAFPTPLFGTVVTSSPSVWMRIPIADAEKALDPDGNSGKHSAKKDGGHSGSRHDSGYGQGENEAHYDGGRCNVHHRVAYCTALARVCTASLMDLASPVHCATLR